MIVFMPHTHKESGRVRSVISDPKPQTSRKNSVSPGPVVLLTSKAALGREARL